MTTEFIRGPALVGVAAIENSRHNVVASHQVGQRAARPRAARISLALYGGKYRPNFATFQLVKQPL